MFRLIGLCVAACGLALANATALAETRVALVVGNSAYQNAPALANPLNDAHDMSAALKAVGFDVVEALDTDRGRLDGALRAFTDKLTRADVALFYYAGHGLQVGLQNYLVPIDAKLDRERDLEFETVKLDFVLRQMELEREGKTSIVILDACRDNPLSRNLARTMGTRSAAIGRGLAATSTGLGTFIAYSTQPGNVALDGAGRNSPFASALIRHIADRARNLPATMIEVRKEVVAATNGAQVPWDHSALTGDFYFSPDRSAPKPGAAASAPAGTGADMAALQERLRKLEEEAKKREATAPPPAPTTTAALPASPAIPGEGANFLEEEGVRVDGLKFSDQREPNVAACRQTCEAQPRCVAYQYGRRSPVIGQCHLFSRIDARQQDASWRSAVGTSSGPPAAAGTAQTKRPAIKIAAPLSRKERGFDIYEGVAIMGEQLKMSATETSAGCQLICRNTPGCVAATYNDFFRGKNVACLVYREVGDIIKTPTSTLMIRTD
jgi:uncharacterized caspase-like protein